MDLKEAKARAYDCMAQIEYWRQELVKANQLVSKLASQESVEANQEEAKKLDKAIDVADKKTK